MFIGAHEEALLAESAVTRHTAQPPHHRIAHPPRPRRRQVPPITTGTPDVAGLDLRDVVDLHDGSLAESAGPYGVSLEIVRSLLLFLSRQRHLRKWMETSSLARRLATRFVAGDTLDQAIDVGRNLNSEGITLTLDHLGESVTSLEEAAQARDVYLRTLAAIQQTGIRANLSLKLTQFGLDLSASGCRANVDQLVQHAAAANSFVRVDMESSDYTDRTLDLVPTCMPATKPSAW